MNGPVMVVVYMPEHDGSGGCQTQVVGCPDHVQPLLSIEFVRTDFGPDIVAENLRRSTRKGLETHFFQLSQEILNRYTQRLGAVRHLKW